MKAIKLINNDKCVHCKHLCVDDCDLLLHSWECNSEVIKELEERAEEIHKELVNKIKKYGVYRIDTIDDF